MYFTTRFRYLLSFCLCLTTARGLVPPPHITPPPIIARQNERGGFLGYTRYMNSWYAESCPAGSSVRTSSTFFACVPATATTFTWATTCVDNVLLAPSGVTFPCGSNICYSIFIHSNLEDGNPKSAYACNTKQTGISVYLTTPSSSSRAVVSTPRATPSEEEPVIVEETTSSTSRTTRSRTTSLSSPFTDLDAAISAAQSSILAIQSGLSNSSTSINRKSSRSKAWIAGPAVGGLAVLAIIAGLALWIRRLKKREKTRADVVPIPPAPIEEVKDEKATVYPQQLDSRGVQPLDGGVGNHQQLDSTPVQRVELDGGKVGR